MILRGQTECSLGKEVREILKIIKFPKNRKKRVVKTVSIRLAHKGSYKKKVQAAIKI